MELMMAAKEIAGLSSFFSSRRTRKSGAAKRAKKIAATKKLTCTFDMFDKTIPLLRSG